MVSLKTRKPADKLTANDLQAFPVWEFALDEEGVEGQDESWVRPVAKKSVPARSRSQIVSAKFITASGKEIGGYLVISPTKSAGKVLDHSGGAIVTDTAQAFLARFDGPMPDFLKQDSLRKITTLLGLHSAEVFPLRFQLMVLVEGEKAVRAGVIAGPKNT